MRTALALCLLLAACASPAPIADVDGEGCPGFPAATYADARAAMLAAPSYAPHCDGRGGVSR